MSGMGKERTSTRNIDVVARVGAVGEREARPGERERLRRVQHNPRTLVRIRSHANPAPPKTNHRGRRIRPLSSAGRFRRFVA